MSKKLWGGRFEKQTDPLAEEFTKSIQYDYKLAECDLIGSLLHVNILKKSGYLTKDESQDLQNELGSILKTIGDKTFKFDEQYEDIHTQVQNILQEKLGNVAQKLHTARSRNDQVVFATKLYCKFAITGLRKTILELTSVIKELTEQNKDLIIPGFTHLQHAQPVKLENYLGAYVQMLNRDCNRLDYISNNLKITLGAGALAGTPILAEKYNFSDEEIAHTLNPQWIEGNIQFGPVVNSLDSVSDRDFVIEILSALSLVGMHLSRLSEDLILWSTKEFDFIEIDEAFCTGSSLMPQKKNPDVLELIRGYAGRLNGNLVSVLTMMKGLPLTYNRDMQLDKEPLFNSFEIVESELKVLAPLMSSLKFNYAKIDAHLKDESLYATDLVYYLVDKKIAFKEAHSIIGELVKYSLNNNILIKDIPEDVLQEKFCAEFIKEGPGGILRLFDPRVCVESKRSIKRD